MNGRLAIMSGMSRPYIFRCPTTGLSVQGLADTDEPSEDGRTLYLPVDCLACGLVHLVNPKTGRLAGQRDAGAP